MLQSTSHKFSRANVSATCKYDEDLSHMLLECPVFIHQRKPICSQIKNQVINCIGAVGKVCLLVVEDSEAWFPAEKLKMTSSLSQHMGHIMPKYG